MKRGFTMLMLAALCARAAAAQGLAAVYATGPNHVWAIGTDGVLRFDGAGWSLAPLPANFQDFTAMAGSGPSNVWALGAAGGSTLLVHWDGTSWTPVAPPPGGHYYSSMAVSPTGVFLLEATDDEADTAGVAVWNDRAWTRERLPHAVQARGMRVVGNEVWIAGYAYFDPRPEERNQFGVLLRRAAGRWSTTFTGRRSTDPVIGAVSWSAFDGVGPFLMLYGTDSSGAGRVLLKTGAGAWRRVNVPENPSDASYVETAFLLGDGAPVIRYSTRRGHMHYRYNGTAWEPMVPSLTPEGLMLASPLGYSATIAVPGTAQAFAIANAHALFALSAAETRVMAGTWCLGGASRSQLFASDPAVCGALVASAAAPGIVPQGSPAGKRSRPTPTLAPSPPPLPTPSLRKPRP